MKPVKRLINLVPPRAFGNKIKTVWCWQASWVERADYVVDFCVRHHLNQFMISYSTLYPAEKWRYLISEFSKRNIPVYALHGTPEYGLPSGLTAGLARIDYVVNYNNMVAENERFTGFHYDVEPYTRPEWDTDRMNVLRSWVENMRIYAEKVRENGMYFGGSFPFWLDTSQDVIDSTPPEFTKPVYQIFIDMVDEYAVMSYRDSAQGIIDTSNDEVAYATRPKIIVSAELTKQTPESITWYEEGVLAMEEALEEVHKAHLSKPGYLGLAIHDFEEYELKRRPYFAKKAVRNLPAKRILPALP